MSNKHADIDTLTASGLFKLEDMIITPTLVYVKSEACVRELKSLSCPSICINVMSPEEHALAEAINNLVTAEVHKALKSNEHIPYDLELEIQRSDKWPTFRKHHIKDECEACPSKEELNLHHIVPFNVDASKELDVTNVITLCRHCHLWIGHLLDWKSWNVNVVKMAHDMKQLILTRPHEIKKEDVEAVRTAIKDGMMAGGLPEKYVDIAMGNNQEKK